MTFFLFLLILGAIVQTFVVDADADSPVTALIVVYFCYIGSVFIVGLAAVFIKNPKVADVTVLVGMLISFGGCVYIAHKFKKEDAIDSEYDVLHRSLLQGLTLHLFS